MTNIKRVRGSDVVNLADVRKLRKGAVNIGKAMGMDEDIYDKSATATKVLTRYKKQLLSLEARIGHEDDEKITQEILRTSLALSISFLPVIERDFRKNKAPRAVYALVALINQIRELGNDMRSGRDMQATVDMIMGGIIQPTLALIAQQAVSLAITAKKNMSTVDNQKVNRLIQREMDYMTREIGQYIIQCGLKMEKHLTEQMME